MTRIEVQDLMLTRPRGFVLGPLSVSFAAQRCSALIGPSGCGKTTLLRCLAGLERIHGGKIEFGSQTVSTAHEMLAPSLRRIGFLFQGAALWPHMTALQHLQFVQPSLTETAGLELLEQVSLRHLARRRPGMLSGGEGQRLALARALAGDPKILLLDEPLQSLDLPLRGELALLIRSIAEQRSLNLIVVTHDSSEALAMADDLIVMSAGRVVEFGRCADLLRSPATGFTAKLLCGATCLPVQRRSPGSVETPFGSFPDGDLPAGDLQMVLFPGSVGVAGVPGERTARARVLHVRPRIDGVLVTVDLLGKPFEVRMEGEDCLLSELSLELTGLCRLLPSENGLS